MFLVGELLKTSDGARAVADCTVLLLGVHQILEKEDLFYLGEVDQNAEYLLC